MKVLRTGAILSALATAAALSACSGGQSENAGSTTPAPATTAAPRELLDIRVTRPAPESAAGPDVITAVTRAGTYTVAGRVRPPGAHVVLRAAGGAVTGLRVSHGKFRATVRLHLGENRIRLTARSPGFRSPAPLLIAIRRRPPPPPPPPPPPSPPPAPTTPKPRASNCDPNYAGACVPVASDVDCAGGSGNGPAYVQGPVRVVGTDIYGLDRDGDGVGCDS